MIPQQTQNHVIWKLGENVAIRVLIWNCKNRKIYHFYEEVFIYEICIFGERKVAFWRLNPLQLIDHFLVAFQAQVVSKITRNVMHIGKMQSYLLILYCIVTQLHWLCSSADSQNSSEDGLFKDLHSEYICSNSPRNEWIPSGIKVVYLLILTDLL